MERDALPEEAQLLEADDAIAETVENKWADHVCPDGRKFSELNNEEKKKMRKKLKKQEKAKTSKELEAEYNKIMEGKDPYEVEVNWCINQLKLGLTRPGVTKEQGSRQVMQQQRQWT